MSNNKSLISIDILRAVAALGVFFYHQHIGSLIGRYTGIEAIGLADNFGAAYAVPLFFLISGYCIHLANLKYVSNGQIMPLKLYYKRRFLRIYPAYFAALVIAVAVNFITYQVVPNLADVIVHVFLLQGFSVSYFNTINLVLWTITVELMFYLIYPLFFYIRLNYSLNNALTFSLLISAIHIGYFSTKSTLTLPQLFWPLNLWFSWCCGAYLADKVTFEFDDLKKPTFAFVYLIILCSWLILKYIPNRLSIIHINLTILLWTAPMIFLVSYEEWLRRNNNWVIRLLTKLGLSSYSLYLLHQPLISLKNYLAHRFLPVQLQFAGLVIGILIIPLAAWYSFTFIEKPFMAKKSLQVNER